MTYHLATASSLPAAGSTRGHGSQWSGSRAHERHAHLERRAAASHNRFGAVPVARPAQRTAMSDIELFYSYSHKDEALKDQLVQSSEQSEAPGGHPRMALPQNRLGHGMGERDRRTLEFGGGDSAVDQLRFHRFGVLPRNRNETRDGAARIRRSARNSRNPAVRGLEWIDLQQASSGHQRTGLPLRNGPIATRRL